MKSVFRLKRPCSALPAVVIMATSVVLAFTGAHAADNDFGYERAARLSAEKKHGEALAGVHAKSVWIDRLNLQRSLASYYGPSETYLQAALDAYQALKELSPTGEVPDAQRQVHKLIFDLRRDASVAVDLEALEKRFRDSGFELEGDYSELDQIEIALRLGQTEGIEERLIAALEKFRDVGNRKGFPRVIMNTAACS